MDGSSRSTQSGGPSTQSELACNICLRRMPNSPVAAYCGHVFCWPCLYRSWPQQGPEVQAGPAITKTCPVCGTALREGFNIVPIYGYDNVASPRSGTERATTTGTTTAAAAAAPDTATSPRPTAAAAAPVSNTPIPPRPIAASFFTTTPRRRHSVAARVAAAARSAARARAAAAAAARSAARARAAAAAAAAPNTAITPRPAAAATAVSSDTDIPPRPNPERITQTLMDAAEGLRTLAFGHGELFGFGSGDRLRPSSSAARNIDLGVAFRSIRRRRNLRSNLRGIDGNGGNRSESHQARVERVLSESLEDIEASLAQMNALFDASSR